jgi:hypothetical protein
MYGAGGYSVAFELLCKSSTDTGLRVNSSISSKSNMSWHTATRIRRHNEYMCRFAENGLVEVRRSGPRKGQFWHATPKGKALIDTVLAYDKKQAIEIAKVLLGIEFR